MAEDKIYEGGSFLINDPAVLGKFLSNPENTFLISFPRTGSHWLRMIMELYFEKPSLVRAFYYSDAKEFTCFHRHDDDLAIQARNVIYLYRNPVDTVYSQMRYHKEDYHNTERIQYWAKAYGGHLCKWLINEAFTVKKTVLTYEGMTKDINGEFSKICGHFGISLDQARLASAFSRVSKEEVKRKTVHDKQVLHLESAYQDEKHVFRDKYSQTIWDTVLDQNPGLEHFFSEDRPESRKRAPSFDRHETGKNIVVRIIKNWDQPDLRRQTPGQLGVWDGISFTLDPVEKCDYTLVLNCAPEPTKVNCPSENIWAIMQEPFVPDIFGWLVSGHEHFSKVFTPHRMTGSPKYIHTQPCLPWHVDKSYDELIRCTVPHKTKTISWITSSKRFFPGHKKRMEFFDFLKNRADFPIDLYGRQIRPLKDKWEGLAPYRYSLAIENSASPHYWTEKVGDCFLSYTLPIYYGCTNLEDYFPRESFVWINIEDPEGSVRRMKEVLRQDIWEKRLDAIREARELVLNKYQLFPFIVEQIRSDSNVRTGEKVSFRTSLGSFSNPMVASDPLVSIIILNHNGLKDLTLCLDSIKRHTPEQHEIIVVDNASTDGSLEYLRQLHNITLVESPHNLGCPPARALGLSLAKGSRVVMLDNDTVVTEGWLGKFEAHFKRHPDLGILGPRSNYVSGAQLVQNVPYKDISGLEVFARKWTDDHKGQIVPTHRLVGFCTVISRAVVDKIGNIDAAFGKFGFEDDDYTWRTIIAGYKAAIANDIFIHHSGGPQGKGDQGYNHHLLDAWEVFKNKWGLPVELKYGVPYNPLPYLLQVFRKECHFIPLGKPGDVRARQTMQIGGTNSLFIQSPEKSYPLVREDKRVAATIEGVTLGGSDVLLKRVEVPNGRTSVVVIPSENREHLAKCIKAVKENTPELSEVIFVVPAARKDKESLKKHLSRMVPARWIDGKNGDKWETLINIAVSGATGEYIAVVQDDVGVTECWFSGMLEHVNRQRKTGIVGAMILNGAGKQGVQAQTNKSKDVAAHAKNYRDKNRHRRIYSRNLSNICVIFRKELFEEIGGFDASLDGNSAFEDFFLRAVLAGYRNLIAGDVLVQRFGSQGLLGNKVDSMVTVSSNRKIMEEKWVLSTQSSLGKKLLVLRAVEWADDLHQQGKTDQAVTTLIDCIKVAPEAREIYIALARVFIESKRFGEAVEVVDSMPESLKEQLTGLEWAGYAKEGLGLDGEADMCADRMLSIDEKYPAAWNLQGVLAYKRGDRETAGDYFKKALDSDLGYGEPYTNLGVLHWVADRKDEAVAYLKKGFVLSPTVPDHSTIYYSAVSSSGDYGDAEVVFREARGLHPNNKNIVFLYIDSLIQQGKLNHAMAEIEDAIAVFGLDDGILAAALSVREKIGQRMVKKEGKRKPTLSLCMIVKNEEEQLVNCLKSVRDVVDEMIVVDTGSTDRTRDLAVAMGGHVFDFEWTDDFSEARNLSLSKAKGDWILVLDADEVISPLDHDRLLKTISREEKQPVALDMVTRNYVRNPGSAGWTENDRTYPQEEKGIGWTRSNKVRLFRNNSLVRFENPVHELLESSIRRAGIRIEKCPIPVHHYGRLDHHKTQAKGQAYYQLGKKKLEERGGGDFSALRELAVQACEIGQFDEAIDLWRRVLVLCPDHVEALFNLAYNYVQIEQYGKALDAAKRAAELSPGTIDAVLNYALCEMLMGNVLKSMALIEGFAESGIENPTLLSVLAATYFINGEHHRGIALLRKLTMKQINHVGYLNSLVEKLIASGQLHYASRLIDAAISGSFADRETLRLLQKCKNRHGE